MPSPSKSAVPLPPKVRRKPKRTAQDQIRRYFWVLDSAWGPQNWWPADSPLEMIVGAFLTQNTAWTNVEKALDNLRSANALSLAALRTIALPDLEQLIRPAGYFRQKSSRIKLFIEFVDNRYGGSLGLRFAEPTAKLRGELLALKGVGPETADSILLYAGNHEVFVVDAYTRRIAERHGLLPADADYEEVRHLFESALTPLLENQVASAQKPANPAEERREPTHPPSSLSAASRSSAAQLFNEMHALIVEVGKNYCRKSEPACGQCPLGKFLVPAE